MNTLELELRTQMLTDRLAAQGAHLRVFMRKRGLSGDQLVDKMKFSIRNGKVGEAAYYALYARRKGALSVEEAAEFHAQAWSIRAANSEDKARHLRNGGHKILARFERGDARQWRENAACYRRLLATRV